MKAEKEGLDQRSLYDQLVSVIGLAEKNGHYDAADWIKRKMFKVQEEESND